MRSRTRLGVAAVIGVGALLVLTVGSYAVASGGTNNVHESLVGYQEVPAVSTAGGGAIELKIDEKAGSIDYTLSYGDLQGSVTQAHIHFGQTSVNGGITLWLCGTAAAPGPAGTPACPASGSVSRAVGAAEVVGPAGQGIAAGEFDELVAAIRAGVTYANVHSTMWPGGEIRAQLNTPNGNKT